MMQSFGAKATAPIDVAPGTLKQWLDAGMCVLVDVREDVERREELIPGSIPMPLSQFDAETLRQAYPGKKLVFHCKAGKRSAKACAAFAKGGEPTHHLAGGIDSWKAAAMPTKKLESGPPIPVMRQVQIVAGLLIAIGTLLAATVSSWFLVIPGFVGCGLVFAGVSGWCGMAMLLGRMPWNR